MKIPTYISARFALFLLALGLGRDVFAQDFTLVISPSTPLTLIPNQNAAFVVSLTPLNGFNSKVALSVGTLPSGVTAQFSPPSLTPPGTSVLQLNAAATAQLGSFTLNVIAVGGGITNTTSSSVTVNFGLLPICTGAFQGQVTDIQTGQPVPGASVEAEHSVVTDTNGMYVITNLTLGSPDNQPQLYSLYATRTDYWYSATTYAYAVCDATNVVNLRVLHKQTGSISGQVLVQGGGPLPGAFVSAGGPEYQSTSTDTNGSFQFPVLQLAYSNAPANYNVMASQPGYWGATTNVVVKANGNTVVAIILVPICTNNTVHGQVTLCDSGLPATNASVTVSAGSGIGIRTDNNGDYTATGLLLGQNNSPIGVSVSASYPGFYAGSARSTLSGCGANVALSLCLQRIPPAPTNNYGAMVGHVYDIQSGKPITNAIVESGAASGLSDTNGAYYLTNVFVGTGNTTTSHTSVSAAAYGYFSVFSNVTVYADQVVTQDLRMLLIGYGAIAGTVRDSATRLPIQGASFSGSINTSTDTNGHYASLLLPLSAGNVPTYEGFSVSATGYWSTSTNTTITRGNTNIVDVYLIKVCTSATIVGNVINALTQQPITNATVSDSGEVYRSAMTDTNGNFILTNITVGNDNSPIQTTLTASAPGFISQTKSITVFCDATIITEFGVPEVVFGGTDGYVTNAVTGLPLTNVFVGTGFGAATATDTNGYYTFTQVPLGANGASRVWTVTAIPNGFPAQTKSVTVFSNAVSRLDFGFGQPLTALAVTATGTPNPVTVGSNLLYLVTLTNAAAPAQQVVLSNTLPPGVTFVSAVITNSPGTPFTAPILANNVITTTATNFPSSSAVSLAIVVKPAVAGTLTNVAAVSSITPDVDPTGSNYIATVITMVVPVPKSQLAVTATGTPNPVTVGSNLLYLVTLTNAAAPAQQVVLSNTLPPGVTFVSAVITNSPGTPFSAPVLANNVITTTAANFASNSAVSVAIEVKPTVAGTLTNVAAVSSITPDVDPAGSNHIAAVITMVVPVPKTQLGVTATGTPNPVTVGSNVLYLVTLTNAAADATQVQLSDTLPPGVAFASAFLTNSPGTPFSAPIYSGNVVTTMAAGFGSNSAVQLAILVTPTVTGTLANVAMVTSSTPDVDPTASNHTATVITRVIAPVGPTPTALLVTATGVPNPVTVGSNLLYLLTLTNTGALAQEVVLSNTLPAGVTFASAFLTNSPGASFSAPIYSGNVVTIMAAGFGSNSAVQLAILVTPTVTGTLTNVAMVTSSTPDVDPTGSNHVATVITSVVAPIGPPPPAAVAVLAFGPITFNPQTGLYQQWVAATNTGSAAAAAVRLAVLGLSPLAVLYNATGSTNGAPYVEYDQGVAAGGSVVFNLEYYDATRQAFISTNFLVTAVTVATPPTLPSGTMVQLDRLPFMSQGKLTLEFATVPGATYVVEYATNMAPMQWQIARPPIVAVGTKTQWIDAGPPKTESTPGASGQRFYRVVQTK